MMLNTNETALRSVRGLITEDTEVRHIVLGNVEAGFLILMLYLTEFGRLRMETLGKNKAKGSHFAGSTTILQVDDETIAFCVIESTTVISLIGRKGDGLGRLLDILSDEDVVKQLPEVDPLDVLSLVWNRQ